MPQSDWSDGYYVGAQYTSGYYPHLAAEHLKFACDSSGIRHSVGDQPVYLELGCGRGVSAAIHAASHPGDYWAIDINPAHVAHARMLAEASGARLQVSDDSFADIVQREDLPMFDIIALHGVWSWISEANRALIVGLARRRLKPGGILYVSYNCMPGWASLAPVRHLLKLGQAQRVIGAERGAEEVGRATDFVQEVLAANPRYAQEHRRALALSSDLAGKATAYLAHEYLNQDWATPYFSEVATQLAGAKLTFVASSRVLDRVHDLHLKPEGLALLDRLAPQELRESVRDFLVNQRFRQDVFVKGATPLTPLAQARVWRDRRFMLAVHREDIQLQISGALGEAVLPSEIYGPVIEALAADDYRPKGLDEVLELAGLPGLRRTDAISAMTVLVGMEALRPVRPACSLSVATSTAYNAHVLARALDGPHLKHLAAPVLGAGVPSARPTQLFLRGWLQGVQEPQGLAESVWAVFQMTGERLVKNDKEMSLEADNLAGLAEMAAQFVSRTVPLYRALGIVA